MVLIACILVAWIAVGTLVCLFVWAAARSAATPMCSLAAQHPTEQNSYYGAGAALWSADPPARA